MNEIPLHYLYIALALLIGISGFFSGSETGLMALNRYRLRHLAGKKMKSAMLAKKMLDRPDRLIGTILLGNNFANIFASSIATIIGLRLFGDKGVAIAALLLTLVILIFAEVTPKTLAARYPEKVAFPAVYVLRALMRLLYPVVWLINQITQLVLSVVGLGQPQDGSSDQLDSEELRTVVSEVAGKVPGRHQQMLINILDLSQGYVDDILVPRNDIVGLDLSQDWDEILRQIRRSFYTRLPVYEESIDNIVGVLHLRTVVSLLARDELTITKLRRVVRRPYFIPERTSLTRQLLEFQERERRLALVVDEYGDIQGLVTLDDILEEIVGDFTKETTSRSKHISTRSDGTFIIDGAAGIRSLNRRMNWQLPTEDAHTINGLMLEELEAIPEAGTTLRIGNLAITIVRVKDKMVRTVRIEELKERKTEAPEVQE